MGPSRSQFRGTRRVTRGLMLAALAVAVPVPAAASAATFLPPALHVSPSTLSVAQGHLAKATITFPSGTFTLTSGSLSVSCTVRIPGGLPVSFPVASATAAITGDKLTIRVPARGVTGTVKLLIECPNVSDATLSLKVRKRHRQRGKRGVLKVRAAAIASSGTVAAVAPSGQPTTASVAALRAQAELQWPAASSRQMSFWLNTGECTDWAAQKREDVIEKVWEADWAAQRLGQEQKQLGDALNWPATAAWAGMTVSNTPVVGALVVWQPGVEGAGAVTGHVGYVESVSADGSTFNTSEMNDGGLGLMGYRTLSSTPLNGRQFILPS